MKNQLVAIVSLSDSVPESVVPELDRVFNSDENGSAAGVIQFTAMPQQKAILVVSKRRDLIDRARTWIKRLDLRNPDAEAGVYVYRVKYGDAKYLADIVTRVFSGSPGGGKDQAAPTEPGTTATTLSADAADAGGSSDETQDAVPPSSSEATTSAAGPQAEGAAPKVSVSPDVANNSIVIYADRTMQKKVLAVLRQIDTPSLQVAINVTMAEVKLTRELSNGVQYFLKSKTVGLGTDDGSFGLFGEAANTISRVVPGFNFVIGSDKNPDVIISAFSKLSDVRILSSPSLVVLDNQTAKLQVGDTVPITTRQAQSVDDSTAPIVNSIDYVDTGIILNVKPRIADNGVVQLRIDQEISGVASGGDSLANDLQAPRVQHDLGQ
jgi:general secretion pathway protein D